MLATFSSKMCDVAHQIYCFLKDADPDKGGDDYATITADASRLALLMHRLAIMRLKGEADLTPLVEANLLNGAEEERLRVREPPELHAVVEVAEELTEGGGDRRGDRLG